MDCGEESTSLVLKKHVVAWCETNASTEDVLDAFTLTGKSVDDGSAFRDLGALEEIREDREDGGKAFRLVHALCLISDTGHELSEDDKVDHERSSKEGILASVVDCNGVATTHEDLRGVLIHGTLRVTDIRDVLDNNAVVGVLTFLVENAVSVDNIINNRTLGDLLGTELCRAAEVLSIVVTEMVVAHDGTDLETSTDKEVSKNALDLGLTRLEVITSNMDTVAGSKLNSTGNKSVLGAAVDEAALLEDSSNSKESGRSNLLLVALDRGKELISSLVETVTDLGKALSGGSPEDNNSVELLGLLEGTDISTDVLNESLVSHLGIEDVVSTVLLVGSDKVGEVDGAERLQLLHLGKELTLEIPVKDMSTGHALTEVSTVDIPTADLKISGADHGEKVVDGDVDFLTIVGDTETDSGALSERAKHVALVETSTLVPLKAETIGNDATGEGCAVVATPADEHNSHLGNLTLGVEGKLTAEVLSNKLAVGCLGHTGGLVLVVRDDLLRGVADVGGCNKDGCVLSRKTFDSLLGKRRMCSIHVVCRHLGKKKKKGGKKLVVLVKEKNQKEIRLKVKDYGPGSRSGRHAS